MRTPPQRRERSPGRGLFGGNRVTPPLNRQPGSQALCRVLTAYVIRPNAAIMDELHRAGIDSIGDLIYVPLRTIDRLQSISSIPKMKFHNLIELLHKDKEVDVFRMDALSVRRKLDELRRSQKEAVR